MEIRTVTGNTYKRRIILKDREGKTTGSIVMSRPVKKKTRPLRYNFKEISALILEAKTSGNARMVLSKAGGKVAMLRRKLRDGEYDDEELKSALTHALKMEKVARKRMKHLQQEEMIERRGENSGNMAETEETEETGEEREDAGDAGDPGKEKALKEKEKELKKLMAEYEKCMRESARELEEMQEDIGLSEEILEDAPEDMSPGDLELLKKKHRAKEMKEIMEADLQYLRSLFDRLEREKQSAGSGVGGTGDGGNRGNGGSSAGDSGVSLEIADMEMPVQPAAAPDMAAGGNVDVTV